MKRRSVDSGATSIEYALIAFAIAVGIVTAFAIFAGAVGGLFDSAATSFP